MNTVRARRVVVAAVGSVFRRDDGAGPAVLELVGGELGAVEVLGALASPVHLLGAWDGADLAIVVDAVAAGDEPGAVHVVEVDSAFPMETQARTAPVTSSHGVGVVEAVRIALALGTAPARVVVVGVEGEDFGQGVGLSASTSRAVERAAEVVAELTRVPGALTRQGWGFVEKLTAGAPARARCRDGSTTGVKKEA